MKKTLLTLLTVLIALTAIAQQQGVNYKALIKDASGNVLVNTSIRIQFSIQYETQGFIVEYAENHVVDTDINGIVIVNIGDGTQTSEDDSFLELRWDTIDYYLNVQVDITGGTNYVDLGTTQFMAVPYAKHAETAANYIDNPWRTSGTDRAYTTLHKVGVKEPNPEEVLDVNGRIKVADDLGNPTPTSAGVIRWNETTADFEGYNGSAWVSLTKNDTTGGWGSSSVTENQVSVAFDAAAGDNFGYSVSISGDTAIIGAIYDNVNNSGSAYIFVRSGGVWIQQAKLTASDGEGSDRFGISVSISGDTAIVGAINLYGFTSDSAYIFVRSGGVWTQQAILTVSDGV
ncbi:MAG: FG-GAP repeat protein, partial [Flavobacteriaceae bacterium]|nr:FG-GAP repeat protein [Flavobacteriaceae bacterium]